MLAGIEFIVSAAAILAGIALFVIGVRRRSVPVLAGRANGTGDAVIRTNAFALVIIALLFFGLGFLIDSMM